MFSCCDRRHMSCLNVRVQTTADADSKFLAAGGNVSWFQFFLRYTSESHVFVICTTGHALSEITTVYKLYFRNYTFTSGIVNAGSQWDPLFSHGRRRAVANDDLHLRTIRPAVTPLQAWAGSDRVSHCMGLCRSAPATQPAIGVSQLS